MNTHPPDPELVIETARNARGAAPVMFCAQLIVGVLLWRDVEHGPLAIWLGFCALNSIRMFVANHLEMRRFARGVGDAWYLQRNIAHGVAGTIGWGALPVIAERYGTPWATTVSLLVVLAVLSAVVYGTAASRVNFLAAVVGSIAPSVVATALMLIDASWFTLLFAMFVSMLIWVHQSVHTLLLAHTRATAENKLLVAELADALALTDPVTQAKNRQGWSEWLDAIDPEQPINILVAEVERLDEIRWLFGHDAGDLVLAEIASRLLQRSDRSTALVRLSDRQFALASSGTDASRALLDEALAERINIGNELIAVTMSSVRDRGTAASVESVCSGLEQRLRAQRTPSAAGELSQPPTADDHELATMLPGALEDREIGAWFQPILRVDSGEVVGWEALVRWQHPTRGVVPPSTLLPLASALGHLDSITRRVLADGVEFVAELAAAGQTRAAVVHVNVEPTDINRALEFEIVSLLEAHSMQADCLVIEITERNLMSLDDDVLDVLESLRNRGARIAIDDLGTGYSSLSHLLDLPVDCVKIDRRFIGALPDDTSSLALVRAVLALARGLNLTAVAEGIETAQQERLLNELGCDEYQGYLASPAIPRAAAHEWLANRSGSTTTSRSKHLVF